MFYFPVQKNPHTFTTKTFKRRNKQRCVGGILKAEQVQLYKTQLLQELVEDDLYLGIEFREIMMQRFVADIP